MREIKLIKNHFLNQKNLLFAYIVFSLFTSISMIAFTYFMGRFLDIIASGNNMKLIYIYTLIMACLSASYLISNYFACLNSTKIVNKSCFSLYFHVINHLKKLPMSYLKKHPTAYLNQRIYSDSNTLANIIIENIVSFIIKTISVFILIILLLKINIKIATILFILFPFYILLYLSFKKQIYKSDLLFREEQNRMFSTINEQLSAVKQTKLNSWFHIMENKLLKKFSVYYQYLMKFSRIKYMFSNLGIGINQLGKIVLIFFGGIAVINKSITIGQFTAMNSYFLMLLDCANYFVGLGQSYQNAKVSFTRILEILDIPVEKNGVNKLDKINEINFTNVSFSYDKEKYILTNFNYTFENGNIYCIIGSNGKGKSTLLELLLGVHENFEGTIKYNSTNIHETDLYFLRGNIIGVCEQEPCLLNTSIYENIAYGINDVSKENILQWCQKLNLIDLIKKLPDGLETEVNEKSSNISGGEKQKISLIRLFIKNPQIIILDEPTSALDKDSINLLKDILLSIKKDKIIFIVTHHNELLSISDRVINLD